MLGVTRAQVPKLYQQGLGLVAKGDHEAAEQVFRSLLVVAPEVAEIHYQLARIAKSGGDAPAAIAHLEQALALKPKETALWELAAEIHGLAGDTDRAVAAFDAMIKLAPAALKPKVEKAHFLQTAGDFETSERLFRRLLKQNPYEGELYRLFLASKKVTPSDPLVAAMVKALKHPRMSEAGKMHLNFAMAKVMEDNGEPAKAFAFLDRANALQQKSFPRDAEASERERVGVLAAQAHGLDRQIEARGTPTPIFVTGMPRSGTTLVERIIASHSLVEAGGETGHAMKLAYQNFGVGEKIRQLRDIPDDALARYAAQYRRSLRGVTHKDALYVTDKSIRSEYVFGFVHAALPDARVIVVHRDPRDIALSIYKNYFKDGTHRYANDLRDIAETIHAFHQSVALWKDRLPGMIHEVQYEDLVTDPEPQARALIAAAGLDWEDACLEFHKVKGTVKTLSFQQVRQPIHKGRAEAWRKCETELKPFTDAWEALTT
ncbi:sulfotransferase [Mesobacterium sp. TK19101]|uniref:Sulfotransferase n=1 Tax=Mesobacterium hydrothermale TaxID=3111907 RepID=A0ABU6HD49_9RHOB|nr:sulfotransferase [Mesobacterium sp. TK19101]MEC3859911.1 sulfotransferase [Mesobacterium sp. TK19101]